jgi:AraC-like DNA-binding protein
MTQAPNQLTVLPGSAQQVPGLRLLADVLAMIRLTGAIFLRAEFTEPFAYRSPRAAELARGLSPGAQSLILFHIVADGGCLVRLESGFEVTAHAGDVIVLPYGDRHVMQSGHAAEPVSAASLLEPPPWTRFPVLRLGGGGASTRFVCGYLRCDDPIFDPVLRALPPLFTVTPPPGPSASWVTASIQYALQATDGRAATAGDVGLRVPELVLTEVLRLYLQSRPHDLGGWLAAVHDPHVGRALSEVHADPARRWTAAELARRSACSRSTLDQRFRQLLGRSPMRYVTEWRLRLAASLLRDTSLGVAAVAYRVGYESEEAFNRAFKRALGAPPAQWRRAGGDPAS